MRGVAHMKSMRQRGNVACLTDAARSSDIRLDQADGTLLDAAGRAEIDRVAQLLKDLIAGEDRVRIHAGMEDLDRATHDFAQKRMDRAIQMALKGQRLDEVEAGMATDGAQ